jgi:hypothetical protein
VSHWPRLCDCVARNRALQHAARSLAENAALARRLADWSGRQGTAAAAVQLEPEASTDDQPAEQVRDMVAGLPPPTGGRPG